MEENKIDIRYLVLWLSDDCNLHCKYCYAEPNFQKENMSFETAKKAIERCQGKEFTLVFAGGEALLNFEVMEKIFDYLEKNHYQCKLSLQTNGTLITEEIAKKLKKMKINIGVSFDATVEVHEELRGFSKKTIEGIYELKKIGKQVNLNCVLNNKTIPFLEKFVEIAYYFGNIQGIGLDLLRITGNCLENYDISVVKEEEIYPSLKKAYQKTKLLSSLTGKKIGIREIEEAKIRKSQTCNNEQYCYASLGQSIVVTPRGDTYPCSSLVGNEQYWMGKIDSELKKISLGTGKYKKCFSCVYRLECKGCCPSRMIYNTSYEEEEKDCVLRKAVFRILEEEREGKG